MLDNFARFLIYGFNFLIPFFWLGVLALIVRRIFKRLGWDSFIFRKSENKKIQKLHKEELNSFYELYKGRYSRTKLNKILEAHLYYARKCVIKEFPAWKPELSKIDYEIVTARYLQKADSLHEKESDVLSQISVIFGDYLVEREECTSKFD